MSTTLTLPTFAPASAAPAPESRRYSGAFVQTTRRVGATRTIVLVCTKLPCFPDPTGILAHKITLETNPLPATGLRTFDTLVSECIADIQRINFSVERNQITEDAGLQQCLDRIARLYTMISKVCHYAAKQEEYWAEGSTPPSRTSPSATDPFASFNLD